MTQILEKNQLLLETGHDIKHDMWNQLVTCRTSSCVHSFCSNVKMLHSFLKLETTTKVLIHVTCIRSTFVLFLLCPRCLVHSAQPTGHNTQHTSADVRSTEFVQWLRLHRTLVVMGLFIKLHTAGHCYLFLVYSKVTIQRSLSCFDSSTYPLPGLFVTDKKHRKMIIWNYFYKPPFWK